MASEDVFRERGWWRPRTLVLDDGGMLLSRWPGRARRIWWSEVRGVEWLGADRAVVRTARDGVDLNERYGDVAEVVARLEARARDAQEAWSAGQLPSEVMAEWLGLRDGFGMHACVTVEWPAVWSGAVVVLLFFLLQARSPLGITLACLLAALWGLALDRSRRRGWPGTVTVLATGEDLTVTRPGDRFQCRWSEVSDLAISTNGDEAILEVNGRRVTIPLGRFSRSRLLYAMRCYRAVLHGRFAAAGIAPPPDSALSRMTEADAPDASRGLSRIEEDA